MTEAATRPRPRLLVFVHIPKTAGTTLRTILSMNEPGGRSRGLGNVFKGGGGISKELISRLRRDKGPDLKGVGLVRGHFPLGIREYLPNYLPRGRELHCFTFLREPTDRTLSHFFAIREHGRGYQLPPLTEDSTLEDALEGGYIHDNLQTRMLSGLVEPFGEVTDEMLEQAKHNLSEELAFFGLTEYFDESLVLARKQLGLRPILYKTSGRVNTSRPRGEDIPAELLESAERCNRYDIELYRFARELFEDAPERKELEYEVELAALRAAKADGEVAPEVPAPEGYGGGAAEWRMLLDAKTELLRLEFGRTRHHIPHVPATVQDELRESQLKAARARTKKLEQQVQRLETASSQARKLERQVERLRAAAARTEELEQEVKRLEAVAAKTEELEEHVGRLEATAARAEKLEQQAERLKAARARSKRLQQQVERLKAASARSEELEREVERLKASSARVEEVEREVERLKASAARAEELERELKRQVERLDATRSRKDKLEQKVQRLRTAAAVTTEPAGPPRS